MEFEIIIREPFLIAPLVYNHIINILFFINTYSLVLNVLWNRARKSHALINATFNIFIIIPNIIFTLIQSLFSP